MEKKLIIKTWLTKKNNYFVSKNISFVNWLIIATNVNRTNRILLRKARFIIKCK